MKRLLLGLGLFLSVSFLDIRQGITLAWSFDLPAANSAFAQKDYQKVIDLLSPEIEKLPRDGLFLLAKSYTQTKKPEAAIRAYTACLSLNSKDFEAKTLIGAEQLSLNKDKDALSTLKESLEINPRYAPTYKALIQYYEKKKNKYELRLLYEDMISKIGETAEAVTNLCELTTLDHLYDISLKHCQRGITLSPQTAANHVNLGIIYKETDMKDKAEAQLKRAAQSFPKSDYAQITYAQYLDDHKNFVSSYVYYKRAVAADPKSVAAYLGLGNSSLEIQKYTESLEAYEKACALDKKAIPAFRRAVNSLRSMKLPDIAKNFESGVEKCN